MLPRVHAVLPRLHCIHQRCRLPRPKMLDAALHRLIWSYYSPLRIRVYCGVGKMVGELVLL